MLRKNFAKPKILSPGSCTSKIKVQVKMINKLRMHTAYVCMGAHAHTLSRAVVFPSQHTFELSPMDVAKAVIPRTINDEAERGP